MDDKKLGEVADRLHMFLPLLYKKVMAWHKNSEGLNPGHYMIMGSLMTSGPMSMSDLGRRIYASKPGMTFLTDRLIKEGLLERKDDEKDRRIINVSLTAKGVDYMKKHREEEKGEIKKNLAVLSDDDLDVLCASLDTVKNIISKVSLSGGSCGGTENGI